MPDGSSLVLVVKQLRFVNSFGSLKGFILLDPHGASLDPPTSVFTCVCTCVWPFQGETLCLFGPQAGVRLTVSGRTLVTSVALISKDPTVDHQVVHENVRWLNGSTPS